MDAHAIIADEIAKTRKAHDGAATDYPRWLALGHEVAAFERLRLRLANSMAEDVLSMSDDEIVAEAREEGIDPEAISEQGRRDLDAVQAKLRQSGEP